MLKQKIYGLLHLLLKHKWSVVGGAIFLVFSLSFLLKRLTPPPTPTVKTDLIQKNFNGSETDFNKVDFVGQKIDLADELTIAQVEIKPLSGVLAKLTKQFNLKKSEKVDNLWQGPKYSLTFDPYLSMYTLVRNETPSTVGGIDQLASLTVAKKIIDDLGFNDLNINHKNVTYLEGAGDLHPTDNAQNAKYILVPFSYQVDGFPVWFGQDNYDPVSVMIDNQLSLQKLTFKPNQLSFHSTGTLPTLSIDQAVNNINHDIASVIFVKNKVDLEIDLTKLTKVTLNKVAVEYRIDEKKVAIPYYRFSGLAVNDKGQKFEVEIITPAVKK